MDRYKKLEDSKFKRKFLDNITGSMEENLVASIQSNLVCLKSFFYFFHKAIKSKITFVMFRNFKMMNQKMHF